MGLKDHTVDLEGVEHLVAKTMDSRNLLRLEGISGYQRQYAWSQNGI
jgi:hypothetical protein